MTLTRTRLLVMAVAVSAASATPAFADATVFLGANTTPANRAVRGLAVSLHLLILNVEGEYAVASEDPTAGAPSLTTTSANVVLQPPFSFLGIQPYFTAGGTIYRETLGTRHDTALAPNIGGGVKVTLIGPLQLRGDYRVVKLGRGALYSPAHRIYAGLNLKF